MALLKEIPTQKETRFHPSGMPYASMEGSVPEQLLHQYFMKKTGKFNFKKKKAQRLFSVWIAFALGEKT